LAAIGERPTFSNEPGIKIRIARAAYCDQPRAAISPNALALHDCTTNFCAQHQGRALAARPWSTGGIPATLFDFGSINAQQSDFLTAEAKRIRAND
jgi:hypothetical protein